TSTTGVFRFWLSTRQILELLNDSLIPPIIQSFNQAVSASVIACLVVLMPLLKIGIHGSKEFI
ncbi:hypothetical protein, partial [Geobacillus stearothermophilus]|uniref:hypothetical protein n=1 Tax=Geobacillus stearothermophilus TaxID=1422 RepID=UPI003D1E21BC